jgi:hydroxyacylglutathione hydrolase
VSYAREHLIPLVDEGLGNSAYLAGLGDGRALAVDASRDLRALRQAASRRGLTGAQGLDRRIAASARPRRLLPVRDWRLRGGSFCG